jgi:cellulose synthase/poly-beta-1,6-N-acetylglucosamine synthase-like glycosyltransferase
MTTLLLVHFWLSCACIFYIFVGYPALMALLAWIRPRPLKLHDGYMPSVAFVMAVHNEEGNIETRLQNYLDLDYPRHLLSFHIGSDASTDATDDIIERFRANESTIYLTRYDRCGKTKIIFELAEALKEDIIIFTDADVTLERNGVRNIVRCFSDPSVGGVVTRMKHMDQGQGTGSRGERKFMEIEDSLRMHESLYWTTVGPTGPCFAVRRGTYDNPSDYRLSDDLHLVITIPLNGHRVWYEPSVVMYEHNKRTLRTELRRRLRIGQISTTTFTAYEGTRYPWRSLVAFQIWSHKLLRNFAAIPAAIFFLTSLSLATLSPFFTVIASLNVIWGVALLGGILCDRLKVNFPPFNYPLYFTAMLAGLTIGSMRAAFSGGLEVWNSQRMR